MDNLKELIEAKTVDDLTRYFFVEVMMSIAAGKITQEEGKQIIDNVNGIIKKDKS